MFKKRQITLAIVTKERPEKLHRLLVSIMDQKVLPLEVIIVDNDVKFSAKKISNFYSKYLNITYLIQKNQGVPHARNSALDIVKTKYLAFVDDDCVLEKNWIANAENVVSHFPQLTYFIGDSEVLNPNSSVALAQHVHQKYWFLQKLKDNIFPSAFNVDTKNIIFKVSDLTNNNLRFDTSFSIGWFDSADTDLGFAMQSKKLHGLFIKKLLVWHEEPKSLKYFLSKGFYRGKLAKRLADKWGIKDEFVYLPYLNWKKYIKSIKKWPKEYKNYFSICKKKSVISFVFIKIYERVFLSGYISKKFR